MIPAHVPGTVARRVTALGVPEELLRPCTSLDELSERAGDPALMALILALELDLPEPFPEPLLAAVSTVGELCEFADVKRSRSDINQTQQEVSDER